MRTNYIKKLNMIRVLLAYLNGCKETWVNLPMFVEAVQLLIEQKNAIEEEARKQDEVTTGIAIDKDHKKAEMVGNAIKVSAAGKAWAAKNKNPELKSSLGFSYSLLLKKKDQECYGICKNIHAIVSPIVADLAAYGIVASDLEELGASIDAFHAVVSAPQLARTEGKNATEQLEGLFDGADTLLHDTLDPIALVLKEANPEFYAGYQNARYIGGNKSRKKEGDVSKPA